MESVANAIGGAVWGGALIVPNLSLKSVRLGRPGTFLMLMLVWFSYYLVLSGIIYDLIIEPPSIGQETDENGNPRPVAFLRYRVNGQFIIEGLSAGAMFFLGGLGFILLDLASKKTALLQYVLLISGAVSLVVAFFMCRWFLRIKVPGYLN